MHNLGDKVWSIAYVLSIISGLCFLIDWGAEGMWYTGGVIFGAAALSFFSIILLVCVFCLAMGIICLLGQEIVSPWVKKDYWKDR